MPLPLEREYPASRTWNAPPPHARNPTKAHTCPRHMLRALAPRKPNLEQENGQQAKERENPRKPNLERQNPPIRAQSPSGRTRAPGTCCVRLLQPSRTQNGKMDSKQKNGKIPANKISECKNPHPHAQSPPRRTRAPRHVLRALAPTKPNSERENGQQAPFSVNCSTISKKWSKRCQHPWKTIFLLAAENRLPRCARMSRTSSRSQL